MKRQGVGARGWGLGMVAGLIMMGSAGFGGDILAARGESGPKITFRVYNYAQVSQNTLAAADREAQRIFRKAGVETDWLNCPVVNTDTQASETCRAVVAPTEIVLRIIPRSKAARRLFRGDQFGFALPAPQGGHGALASVFYSGLENFAGCWDCDRSQILAHTVAHEIGHLLLPGEGHSLSGIMRASWENEDLRRACRGDLVFTPQEAESIRVEVRKRVAAAASARAEPISFVP